ncbi:MAG: ABC transporter ATP-binding protein, partial [Deltaproteobacteria bacterium]|nr:ABC transporter ATP-binding protein [Deltaproteobacteria bacterium]
MIGLRSLSLSYGAISALSSIDLEIEAGERVALVGPSGSGKTPLLRLVAGLENPSAGQIVLSGRTATPWLPPSE